MTVQQWYVMQDETYLRKLVKDIPNSIAYGCVKAYNLLPQAAKDVVLEAFQEAQDYQ